MTTPVNASSSRQQQAPWQPRTSIPWPTRFTDEAARHACAAWLDDESRRDACEHRAVPLLEAWAIATAWTDQLEVGVRLVFANPRTGTMGVVQSYEWVEFHFPWGMLPVKAVTQAAVVRAVCGTWNALSRCSGYSTKENPAFWRHVFGVVSGSHASGNHAAVSYGLVQDCVRFFDSPACDVFPRVRLDVGFHGAKLRKLTLETFLQGRKPPRSYDIEHDTVDTQLATILARLHLLVTTNLREAAIPVSLMYQLLIPENQSPPSADQYLASLHSKAVDTLNARVSAMPRFVVNEVCNPELDFLQLDTRDFSAQLTVPSYTLKEKPARPHERADEVVTVFGMRPSQPSITVREVFTDQPQEFPFVCSAMPHTSSVASVHVVMSPRLPSDHEAAWLGYALFHPDTQSSTWRHLTVNQFVLSESTLEIIRSMAAGNNLLPILTGDHAILSMNYCSTRLEDGTTVHAEQTTEAVVLWTTRGMREREVDICLPGDWEISGLREWVCVIVCGFGHGWVKKAAVGDVTSRPPSSGSLISLRLRSPHASYVQQRQFQVVVPASERLGCLTAFVALVGATLRSLDVSELMILNEGMLHRMLQHCPVLTTLSVFHDDSFWADSHLLASLPCRLEELSLRSGYLNGDPIRIRMPSDLALSTLLRTLRSLRISPPIYQGLFREDTFAGDRAILVTLLDRLPGLQYLHYAYKMPSRRGRLSPPYATIHSDNWARMGLLLSGKADRAVFPLSVRSRLAFCCAMVACASSGSALSLLDQLVVSMIFDFAAQSVPRDIWLGER